MFDSEDESLCEAIQTVFEADTEAAVLFWDAVPMVLSYKYTLSFLVQDLLALLERLASTSRRAHHHVAVERLPV